MIITKHEETVITMTLRFDPSPAPSTTRALSEEHAVRVAVNSGWLQRLRVGLRAGWALLRDPGDTQQVFLLGAAANAPHVPTLLTKFLTTGDGLDLMMRDASIDTTQVDYDALRGMDDDAEHRLF